MKKQLLLGLMAMTLPLTMWAQAVKTLTVTTSDVTYDGDDTKSGITVKAGNTPLEENKDYSVVYMRNETRVQKVRDAGKYTGTITMLPTSDYWDYTVPEGDNSFTVNKLKVKGGVNLNNNVEVEYTGSTITGDAKLLNALVGDLSSVLKAGTETTERANFLAGLKVVGFQDAPIGPDVKEGGYGVQVINTLTNKEEENYWDSNYEYEPASEGSYVALTITAKKLTATIPNGMYDGMAKPVTTWGKTNCTEWNEENKTYTGVVAGEAENLQITFTASENVVDAKDYSNIIKATVKDNPNYVISKVSYEIKKADLTITSDKNLAVNYGNIAPLDLTDKFTYTGLVNADKKKDTDLPADALKLTMKRDGDAESGYGKYSIYPYVDNKKVVEKDAKDNELTCADALANYTIKYEVRDYNIYTKNIDDVVNFTYTVDEEADLTYQGKDFELPTDFVTVVFNTTGETLEYGKDYTLEATNRAGKIRDAGTNFRVIVKAVEGSQKFNGEHEISGIFTVAKAPLTVTPKDDAKFQKVVGQDDPDFYELFTYDALVGEDADNEKEVLKIYRKGNDAELLESPGYYWIFVEEAAGKANYDITYTRQKMVLLAGNITLYGGELPEDELTNTEKLAMYNGETVTVTIKNFQEMLTGNDYLAKNAWHSMVLPFDTKARDISAQLGYAIVDVADKANNEAGNISFKLTVGDVPANTLFLVKLDEKKSFGEEDENNDMVFEGVTISYNPDEEGEIMFEDGGGNAYYAVYETTELPKDETLFVAVRPGSNGGGFFEANTNNITVYPLNGYIKSNVSTPAATRFFVEEVDGSTTAINAITGETETYAAEGWYSVDGVKLNAQPTQKGIYINNGKKVVIK